MVQLADHLDAQAQVLRGIAAGVLESGHPYEVRCDLGAYRTLTALGALDIIDDAEALEADAVKLRSLYH